MSASTTLARAWIVTRRDGRVFGFTDHDRPLTVAGVVCEASGAMTASESTASLGLGADELDATGALSSATITEAEIAAGRWDGAKVRLWEVDWSAPASAELVGEYGIGEIERSGGAFRAELRSRAAGLDRPQGRAFLNACDARLGDPRCGVNMAAAGRAAAGSVIAVPGPLTVHVSGVGSLNRAHLPRGLIVLGGANAGLDPLEIRAVSDLGGGKVAFHVWRAPAAPVAVGDAAAVSVGCDKSFKTCVARFANGVNFRGCPHMPGNDAITDYGRQGDPGQDGGSRFG